MAAPEITVTPITVLTDSSDQEGCLVLADGGLVAVLVKLAGAEHGRDRGRWHLEAGFGRCAAPAEVFPTLPDALAWVGRRLAGGRVTEGPVRSG